MVGLGARLSPQNRFSRNPWLTCGLHISIDMLAMTSRSDSTMYLSSHADAMLLLYYNLGLDSGD